MQKEKSEFTKIFEQFLETWSDFSEISEIVRRNSRAMGRRGEAKIWIIGGFVYGPIIRALYGEIQEPSQIDIDFLISRGPASEDLYIPKGWVPSITEAGYFYLDKGKIRIDLNYLYSFHSITSRHTRPKFKYFFAGTPLDIQSIAYDLTDRNIGVIGKRGIEAIKNRVVRINNFDEAKFEAEKREMSIEDLVVQKARELNFGHDFTPIYPPSRKENRKENGQEGTG